MENKKKKLKNTSHHVLHLNPLYILENKREKNKIEKTIDIYFPSPVSILSLMKMYDFKDTHIISAVINKKFN